MAVENDIFSGNLFFRIGILSLILFGSCRSRTNGNIKKNMFFSLYDSSQNIIDKNYYKMELYESRNDLDSLVITDKRDKAFSFLQYTDSSKMSLFCDGEEFSVYSIADTLIHVISNKYCRIYPPFFNTNTLYRGAKNYLVDNHNYKVYHFVADNGVDGKTYDCYFLEKEGPLCFYSFDSNEYLICDSLSSSQISGTNLKILTKNLITDSLFFSRFTLDKYLPNFHRPTYK